VLKTELDLVGSLVVSDNGSRLALTFKSSTVEVLDIPDGKLALTIRGHRFLAFSPDSQLAVIKKAEAILVHDFTTGSRTEVACSYSYGSAAAFSPDGTVLAVALYSKVFIYSKSSWKTHRWIEIWNVRALAISLGNKWIACARDSSVELLDMNKGGTCVTVLNAEYDLGRPTFSSNGRQLVTDLGELTLLAKDPATPQSEELARLHFGICNEWVVCDGRKILWLPPDCRRRSTRAIRANTLAWWDEEGNVHYIVFDPAKMVSTSGRPTSRMLTSKWERPPKAKGTLAGKCKRILRQIVGD
jgi:WD40 repeat protein